MKLSKRQDLVDVKDFGFDVDTKFVKKYSKSNKILLNKKVLEVLEKAKEDLPEGYNFCITYGYRSLEEQTKIVKETEKELKKSHPDNWEELLKKYTGGYEELKLKKISPMNHRSGKAVDLKIVRSSGKELDMGGEKMDDRDQLDYYENKKDLSKKELDIKENRRLLKTVLERHGFENYPDEWWHWGHTKTKRAFLISKRAKEI